jgi:hypothetical protein
VTFAVFGIKGEFVVVTHFVVVRSIKTTRRVFGLVAARTEKVRGRPQLIDPALPSTIVWPKPGKRLGRVQATGATKRTTSAGQEFKLDTLHIVSSHLRHTHLAPPMNFASFPAFTAGRRSKEVP